MEVLHLFPKAGFDQSATTPVLLGVLVSWLFTEAFGWVFAGLVVPGYLAALFIIDPRSAAIDVVEAVFTYGISRSIGEHLAKTGITSRLFGRERFFLVVLVSVVVRLAVDGVILPRLASHASWAFSVGLVVVPLTANACWKTGLPRGVVQNGVPALIVYVMLRYLFIPHTNLSLAGFTLATENIAGSFLSSPKAYILLLTGAVLAASANLRYGWDFNGILIPALLSLVVVSPVKFAATIAEVLILVAVVRVLIRITPLKRWNIEGPRRLVIFFSVDYALRFIFAGTVGKDLPGADVVDLMGFGYLLPTLLAVKISQKQISALVILPAIQISLAGFVLGTLVGFLAMLVDSSPGGARPPVQRAVPAAPMDPASAALWVAALARPDPKCAPVNSTMKPTRTAALLDALRAGADAAPPAFLQAQRLDGNAILIRERFETLKDRVGDPSVLAGANAAPLARRLVLLVPSPLSSPEVAALAGSLVAKGIAHAVVISGFEEEAHAMLSCDPSAFSVARAIADQRHLDDAPRGVVVALRRSTTTEGTAVVGSLLSADDANDALTKLREAAGEINAHEGGNDPEADMTVELPLGSAERWLAPPSAPLSLVSSTAMAVSFGDLQMASVHASLEELLVTRRLLLEPLLEVQTTSRSLPLTRFAATMLGYRLHGPSPLGDGDDGLVLLPGDAPRPLALMARARGVHGAVLEVPQGWRDGVRDFALRLGTALKSDAILVGLEAGGGFLTSDALREAHAVAAAPAIGREAGVVVLREGPPEWQNAGVATLATWGGDRAKPALAAVEKGLKDIGVTATEAQLDVSVRDASGRSLLGDTPLVSITVDAAAIRTTSLDAARRAARDFGALPNIDGACGDVAVRVASGLPPAQSSLPSPGEIIDIARRAAVEESVAARRTLDSALATTATRAALARSPTGVYLIIVGRSGRGLVVAAIPTVVGPDAPSLAPVLLPTLSECAPHLEKGGACAVEGT